LPQPVCELGILDLETIIVSDSLSPPGLARRRYERQRFEERDIVSAEWSREEVPHHDHLRLNHSFQDEIRHWQQRLEARPLWRGTDSSLLTGRGRGRLGLEGLSRHPAQPYKPRLGGRKSRSRSWTVHTRDGLSFRGRTKAALGRDAS
jgi:hypothetical protein